MISRAESGRREVTVETLVRLALGLECSLDVLVFGDVDDLVLG